MSEQPLVIYIISGEPSGDLLGAHLMRALKEQSTRPIQFYGIGGERMSAEGLSSLFPYHELAMLGFIEVLPYAFNIAARIGRTAEDIRNKHPAIVVTIDSPGFCYRLVKRLRKEHFPAKFVHYVAPSVWAYKPQRAERCARTFDHLLTLLPFEPPYFEKEGLPATFVGHPVVAETKTGDAKAFREKYQLADDVPLFCLFPGSRKSEAQRHMPIFAQAVAMLATVYPNLAIAVSVPPHVMPFIAPYFENCPFRAIVTANEEDKKNAVAASNVAIVKSGTVTLEVAMAGVPMVVAYQVNPVSAWAYRRIRLTTYVNLINILRKKEIIPELLQELCTPLAIASAAAHLLDDKAAQETQKREASAALSELRPAGGEPPSSVAARTILRLS